MTQSLRALLEGAIDYAGLFPPASFSLEQTVRNYAAYRQCDDAWMLGKLIVPAARLMELKSFESELFSGHEKVNFSVLIGGGSSEAEFQANIRQDHARMTSFLIAYPNHANIASIELKLPRGVAPEAIVNAVNQFPLNWASYVEADQMQIVTALKARTEGWFAGVKLRCGGVTPDAFPEIDDLADLIARTRDAFTNGERLSLKFTAGLHHPFRHLNESVPARMHGFINVYVASMLAFSRDIPRNVIEKILADERRESFQFDDEQLRYDDWKLTVPEIKQWRKQVTSFGSCSFDEPREDLKKLGLM